jgi:hypothetical protein
MVREPIIGLRNEVHFALGRGVGHSVSYTARLLGAIPPVVGI